MIYLYIGIGGMIGSMLRYGLSLLIQNLYQSPAFTATLFVNVIGCFFLGWLTSRTMEKNMFSPVAVKAIGTGVIGSFTTFSTFSVEVVELFINQGWIQAGMYLLISALSGFLFVSLGFMLGEKVKVRRC